MNRRLGGADGFGTRVWPSMRYPWNIAGWVIFHNSHMWCPTRAHLINMTQIRVDKTWPGSRTQACIWPSNPTGIKYGPVVSQVYETTKKKGRNNLHCILFFPFCWPNWYVWYFQCEDQWNDLRDMCDNWYWCANTTSRWVCWNWISNFSFFMNFFSFFPLFLQF